MKMPYDASAQVELVFVRQSEERLPVTIKIGSPYINEQGLWACPAEMTGLDDRFSDIVGEDSLQALCLAFSLIRRLMNNFVQDGGRIFYVSGEEFPFETYFP